MILIKDANISAAASDERGPEPLYRHPTAQGARIAPYRSVGDVAARCWLASKRRRWRSPICCRQRRFPYLHTSSWMGLWLAVPDNRDASAQIIVAGLVLGSYAIAKAQLVRTRRAAA